MRTGRPRKKIDDKLVIKRYKGGESSKILSKDFGISTCAIINILKKNNIKLRNKGAQNIVLDVDIKKDYNDGMSCSVIGAKYGVSSEFIRKKLKKDINLRQSRVAIGGNCDEHYFEKIDSEEKAYWLGFLAADGNVSKKGYVIQLCLSQKDSVHLSLFKKHLNIKVDVKDDKRGFSYISFKNKVLWQHLVDIGIMPQKTVYLKKMVIPKKLDKHFWRGMVDGDGCIPEMSRAGSERYVIELVGTKDICQSFLEYSCGIVGAKCGLLTNYKNYCKASLEGYAARVVISNLYIGAKVFLQRKMDLAERKKIDISDGVHEIGQNLADGFLQENHYLYSSPIGMKCLGLWEDGILIGVAAFGVTSSMGVAESIFGVEYRNHVWELRRFALKSGNNIPNLASEFLSKCLNRISIIKPNLWAVVAFSDENVGHYGTIYKACSAIYTGKTIGGIIAKDKNGKIYSGRHLSKIKSIDGMTFDLDKGRHKYLFILGHKDEKKKRIGLLKVKPLVYTKSNSVV